MVFENFLKNTAISFPKTGYTVLRLQKNSSRRCTYVDGALIGNGRSDGSGVCARVYKGGVYGFASMGETDESAVIRVLKEAAANAEYMEKYVGTPLPPLPAVAIKNIPERTSFPDAQQQAYLDLGRQVDDYIKTHCTEIVSRRVAVSSDDMDKIIFTSDASSGGQRILRTYIHVIISANTPGGTPVELMKSFGGFGDMTCHFQDLSPVFAGIDRLYDSLMKKRNGVFADAGRKQCILGTELSGMLAHEAVGHTVEADLVIGGSVAAEKIGTTVASPLVSMTDFANTAFGETVPLPVYLDDEGVPAKDALLIQNGILTGYMNNRETAARFQMNPCGNARGYGYSSEPLIRMRNTAVLPGKDCLEDMIASVEDGYYLISSNNGQADTTGEFMFGVTEGYEIKNGKLGRPILDTTITGVAFDMLKTVDMVGNRVEWVSAGMCGKKQPMPVSMGGPALRCYVTIGGR